MGPGNAVLHEFRFQYNTGTVNLEKPTERIG